MTADYKHPITPPPELVHHWAEARLGKITAASECQLHIATQAARWGSDQELEACCAWASNYCPYFGDFPLPEDKLRDARRPKPPSLKEQALGLLNEGPVSDLLDDEVAVIRRALEQLPDAL